MKKRWADQPLKMPFLLTGNSAATHSHRHRLIHAGGPVLTAFLVGAIGMVLGAVVGCAILGPWLGGAGSVGGHYQATCVAASLCASYVGGSINFVAVSQVRGGMISAERHAAAVRMGVLLVVIPSESQPLPLSSGCWP